MERTGREVEKRGRKELVHKERPVLVLNQFFFSQCSNFIKKLDIFTT